jgi:hypothetical protein
MPSAWGVQAHYIALNGGNLFIGAKEKPYPGKDHDVGPAEGG